MALIGSVNDLLHTNLELLRSLWSAHRVAILRPAHSAVPALPISLVRAHLYALLIDDHVIRRPPAHAAVYPFLRKHVGE